MLEIASQITLCLLLAALIGFIIGFMLAKMTNKKPQHKTTKPKPGISVEDTEEEHIKISTESATEEALVALQSIEEEPTAEATLEVEDLMVPEALKEENIQPELLDAPKNGKKDSLSEIKGIGPKVEEKLNEAGIYHFRQIANWTEANIKWLEEHTTFAHRAKKDLWVNQAKALV